MDDQRKPEQAPSQGPTEQVETNRIVIEKAWQERAVGRDSVERTQVKARTEVPPPEEAPPRDRSRDQGGG